MAKMLVCVLVSAVLLGIKAEENGSMFSNTTEEFFDQEELTTISQTESTVAYADNVTLIPVSSDVKSPEDSWSPDANYILKAFKDFLFQERSSDLSTRNAAANVQNQTDADRILEMLSGGFQEVFTTMKDEIEAATSATPAFQDLTSPAPVNKVESKPLWDLMRINISPPKRRQSTQNFANLTTSCSSCYSELSSCVQKCFVQNNCKNVERNARKCPPVPTRLCNPFTPWSPVDQCQVDTDCESPLVCCDDGCVKRCSSGIWRS